jgi:hypothetical protein
MSKPTNLSLMASGPKSGPLIEVLQYLMHARERDGGGGREIERGGKGRRIFL